MASFTLDMVAGAALASQSKYAGQWRAYHEMRSLLGLDAFGRFQSFVKLRVVADPMDLIGMTHYDDKYTLRAEISHTGKIDEMTRIPKGTWHMIWNQLGSSTRWAIVENIFGKFILVDVPTTMRDDLARTYMGEFTTHETMDAAIMFAMIMKGTKG